MGILALLAALSTGVVFFPGKGDTLQSLSTAVAVSTVCAYVTIALVLIALLLPRSGSVSTRRQAWKINLCGVPIIAAGMAVAVSRSGAADDVAVADWTTWLIATSVAALMLLALTAKTFRSVKSAPVEKSGDEPSEARQDLDRDYDVATQEDKRRAMESVEGLMDQHSHAKVTITRYWQDAVTAAAHKNQVSKAAAAHACRATAWRWQLELISSPDYEDWEE